MRNNTVVTSVVTIGFICASLGQLRSQAAATGSSEMLVTTAWLASHLRDEQVSLLHVGRDRTAYDAAHIPGARFVPLGDLVVERDGSPNELPPASQLAAVFEKVGVGNQGRIVIYGEGRGLLAARLFFTLDYLGHAQRAALLDGGLEQWRAEGRPLTTSPTSATARPFDPHINPDVLVTLPVARDISWRITGSRDSEWALIDARPAQEFSGERPGDGVTRPGHIPGATGIFWETMLLPGDAPVLKPAGELRSMLADAGITPESRIVTYCRTGVQASFAYFVVKHLGYRVKMYDGSFIEWSAAGHTQVAHQARGVGRQVQGRLPAR